MSAARAPFRGKPAAARGDARGDARRKSRITLVHVGKRDLRLDDATYRAMLQAHGGHSSTADMSLAELDRVLAHMQRSGFRVKVRAGSGAASTAAPARTMDASATSSKARAMWIMLHDLGVVRDPSEAALTAYCKRVCKVDVLHWVRDAVPLLESLKGWLSRALPVALGPYLTQPCDEWAGHMPVRWRADWAALAADLHNGGVAGGKNGLLQREVALWRMVAESKKSQG